MLQISKNVYNELLQHALKDAPIEACGYLAEKDGVITLHYPLTNKESSAEHFSFDPKEQFDTVRKIRAEKMKLAAVYHSHPQTPARPSQEDIRLAFDPDVSYVIVSLADGKTSVRSFRISRGSVEEEAITIVE